MRAILCRGNMEQKSKVIQLGSSRALKILTNTFGSNRYSPMAERVARQLGRDLTRARISVKLDTQKANPLSTLERHLDSLNGSGTPMLKEQVLSCLDSMGPSVDKKSREVLTNILKLEADSDIRAALTNLLKQDGC